MAIPSPTELPSLREVLGAAGSGNTMDGAARKASTLSIGVFLACFFVGMFFARGTGKTQYALLGTLGAFGASAICYFSLRGRGPSAVVVAAEVQTRALGAYGPWMAELRRNGFAPSADVISLLVRIVCALRPVRSDYFVVADDSLRFLTLGLCRVAMLRGQLGLRDDEIKALAENLVRAATARTMPKERIFDDPEFIRLGEAITHVQTALDRVEILMMAAVQLTHEARRLGQECELLLAQPKAQTGPLLGARVEREKALQQALGRVFDLFETHSNA